jgi:hypothetical protein
MSKTPLYASASPQALGTAPRDAEPANRAVTTNAVVIDAHSLLETIKEVSRRERIACQDWVNQRLSVLTANKYLYRTSEAKAALGIGTQRLYDLINDRTLDARRFGKRTYITAESIEAFIASLPPVVTPTMAKADQARVPGRNPWAGVQQVGAEKEQPPLG